MASLKADEFIDLIKKPKNKTYIDLAVYQEERLLMHCESILEKYNLPFTAWRNFTSWWQSLIAREKYVRIDEMLGTPLSTLSVTKDIFDQLGKFIDAQDRYVSFNFVDPDYTNDYNNYLEKINDDTFWRQKAVEGLKTDICSMVVIDLPSEIKSDRPEPYKYFVSPSMFIDVDIDKFTGNVEYFAFRQSNINWDSNSFENNSDSKLALIRDGEPLEKVIAIDDEFYRVFVKKTKGSESNKTWILLSENAHNLGYCPVIDFWQPSIKGTNGINKRGPITNILKKLDYLLFYQALADYMDLYGPFPILIQYAQEEDTWDDKAKEVNNGNYTGFDSTNYNVLNTNPIQNPANTARGLIGPGSVQDVPIPADKNDHNFMESPMKFVGMEVDSLKHVQDRIDKLKCDMIELCTGEDKEYLNEIAKNEEMMSASFERKETIFTWVKKQVERVHRFATKTQAELRYGKGYFISCTVDYGSEFFFKDSMSLSKEYKLSLDNGMPATYCLGIAQSAIEARYKNNSDILARMRILVDLEPYLGLDWLTIKNLGINTGDKINFIIKANFHNFISRFELENGSIVKFGSLISYTQKIQTIKTVLNGYAKEIDWVDTTKKIGAGTATE